MAFIPSVSLASRTSILPTFSPRGVAVTAPLSPSSSVSAANVPPYAWRMSSNGGGGRSNRLRVALTAGVIGTACTFLLSAKADASIFNFRGTRPSDLGVQYGRYLNSCPTSPNCVSSSANVYDSHYVPSWTYNNPEAKKPTKSMAEAVEDLKKVLSEYPRVEIIESNPVKSEYGEGYYIYAEFQSKLLGFIDDVEFYFRPDSASSSTVEYRSASRLGESDMGANRSRIRDLRVALQNIDSRWASTGY